MAKRYEELVKIANHAKLRAHAPFSKFPVGAALLTSRGKIYTGCNIEISSYGLTICAERTAIFKAISDGDHEFDAIAVITNDPQITPPCGACRQVLWDLAGNIDIVMANQRGRMKVQKLKQLIPNAFDSKNLKRTPKKR